MCKLSEKENFNGCHSRMKALVMLLLYRAYQKSDNRGFSQSEIASKTNVSYDTVNSSIAKWHEWRLIKRHAGVDGDKPIFRYTLGTEGVEWVQSVMERRPDVIADSQKVLDKYAPEYRTPVKADLRKLFAPPVRVLSFKETLREMNQQERRGGSDIWTDITTDIRMDY